MKLEKKNFQKNVFTKLDCEGGKALVAGPQKNNFFAAYLTKFICPLFRIHLTYDFEVIDIVLNRNHNNIYAISNSYSNRLTYQGLFSL